MRSCWRLRLTSARDRWFGITRAEVMEVETEEEGVILNLNDPETVRKAIGR